MDTQRGTQEDRLSAARAVITLATTKPIYVEMAFTLARSFQRWNRDSGIGFHLITDLEFPLPPDLSWIQLVRVSPGALGEGFSPKLHLDSLAPARQTMFIDSDCLCLGPLGPAFDRFAGRPVAVVGDTMSTGQWWGDIAALCQRFHVPALPHFNGGLYYVEPGAAATAVYDQARVLERQYDEIGLLRLRGRPNDEILMSIAMAEAGLMPLADDGTILGVFNVYPKFEALDVFAGRCRMSNPAPPDPMYKPTVPIAAISPLIPHFVNNYTDHWRYRAEAQKLRQTSQQGLPDIVAKAITAVEIEIPGWSVETAKNTLRPAFHKRFGVRRMTPRTRV